MPLSELSQSWHVRFATVEKLGQAGRTHSDFTGGLSKADEIKAKSNGLPAVFDELHVRSRIRFPEGVEGLNGFVHSRHSVPVVYRRLSAQAATSFIEEKSEADPVRLPNLHPPRDRGRNTEN
jgi:hypothetical protein